jgi:glycosyltransferase involved in cell wall biosynthesis
MVPSRIEFEETRHESFLKSALGHVVPNGVDHSLFRPRNRGRVRSELGLSKGLLFVSAGRLDREKAMHNAIRALAALGAGGAEARLVIIGSGPEREPLGRLARSLGLDTRVIFVGTQPHEVVAKYFAAADMFLFPTERAEAAPLVLPQAMACAAPTVASDIGGIPEVVLRSGVNGLLVPPGDVRALAKAMRTLVGNEELRWQLGEAARHRVLAEYTIERMVERTLFVYRVAMARAGAAHARGHAEAL